LRNEFTQTQRRIQANNGRALLVMHPFFFENRKGQNSLHEKELYDVYLKRLLATLQRTTAGIIVLEEIQNCASTKKRLIRLGINALIVPTFPSDAAAVTQRYPKSQKEKTAFHKKLLHALGAKRVQLSGMLSYAASEGCFPELRKTVSDYEKRWLPRTNMPKITIGLGCLGSTYYGLVKFHSDKFEKISLLPNLCYPVKPQFKRIRRRK
jgi:hypothetical protein